MGNRGPTRAKKKLESMENYELIDFLNANAKYEDIGEDELGFEIDYIGDDWID